MEQQKITLEELPESFELVGLALNRSIFLNGEVLLPGPSQEIYNHSPDGFNWGYSGSGPSQLALAICARFLGHEEALMQYQLFKAHVIARLPEGNFKVKINLRYWYRAVVQNLIVILTKDYDPFLEILPFELEHSEMKVMDNLTFTPAPEEVTGRRQENPLL